jgi:hypothetical protein
MFLIVTESVGTIYLLTIFLHPESCDLLTLLSRTYSHMNLTFPTSVIASILHQSTSQNQVTIRGVIVPKLVNRK